MRNELRDNGPGDILNSVTANPPPLDGELISLLQERDALATEVVLRDGRRLTVFDIAWGYDLGDQFAHVTTNISPGRDDRPIDVFFTSEVVKVADPETSAVLFAGQ